jgi:hypothetical protein
MSRLQFTLRPPSVLHAAAIGDDSRTGGAGAVRAWALQFATRRKAVA